MSPSYRSALTQPRAVCVMLSLIAGLSCMLPPLLGIGTSVQPEIDGPLKLHWSAFETILLVSLAVTLPLALDNILDYQLPLRTTLPRWLIVLSLALPTVLVYALHGSAIYSQDRRSIGYSVIMMRETLLRGALLSFMIHKQCSVRLMITIGGVGVLSFTALQIRLWMCYFPLVMTPSLTHVADILTSSSTLIVTHILYQRYFSSPSCNIAYHYDSFYAFLYIINMIMKFGLMLITHDIGYLGLSDILICTVATTIPGRQARHEKAVAESIISSKRDYVSYMSHEIRTPLNAVYMGIQLLAKEFRNHLSPDHDFQNILSDIQGSCRVAIDILNEFLLVNKLEAGTLALERQPVAVVEMIKNVASPFENQARLKGVNFEFTGDCHIDPVLAELDAYSDVDIRKISQVLRNLIANALKFTPSGGSVDLFTCVKRRAPSSLPMRGSFSSTSVIPDHGYGDNYFKHDNYRATHKLIPTPSLNINDCILRVEVHDTGVGIAEENKKRLFKEIVQFNAAQLQNGGGSGLGLWISKQIVDLHGGVIGMSSELGKGSVFFFELDLCGPPSDLEVGNVTTVMTPSDLGSSPCPSLKRISCSHASADLSIHSVTNTTTRADLRVLVVDDSAVNRKMVCRLMASSVLDIHQAENGIKAVEKVRESLTISTPFDLIFMDATMPEMGGAPATRLIREMGFKGKIVFLTGNATPEDRAEFMNAGADDVIIKPCTLERIDTILSSLGALHVVNDILMW